MTLKANTAEGGTSGVDVTTSNSSNGGDAFTAVALVNSGAGTFYGTNPFRGSMCYRLFQPSSASACTVEWSDTASASFTCRFYFRFNGSYPSATCQGPLNVRSASAYLGRLNLTNTGQVSITLGAANASSGLSASSLALDTWYRFEVVGTGFGTAATSMTCNVYVGDSTTPFFTTLTVTGQTTAEQVALLRYGRNNAVGSNDWLFDDLAQNIGSSTVIGPSNSGDAGLDKGVEPYELVTLIGTGSGTWSQLSGPDVVLNGSGATRTFTAPVVMAGATLAFAYGGDSMAVTVYPPTERFVSSSGEKAVIILLA